MTTTQSRSGGSFHTAARVTLVLVYVVIIAGSVVRSTGAGMGCPDWPKCFGHYIPPTHVSELEYREGRRFKAGHFIIWQSALWKARHDLVATASVDTADWEKYTKHDYAVFNAAHTWTEYGNRLSGMLLGISAIVLVVTSWKRRRWDRASVLVSIAALLLISFEGWLGALVVESKLAPVKITTHMVVAMIIVAVMVWVVRRARGAVVAIPSLRRGTIGLIVGCIALTVVQGVLGTQVREQVDIVKQAMGEATSAGWIDQLGGIYIVHRSFAWALLMVNAVLLMRVLAEARDNAYARRRVALLALLLATSAASGIILQEAGIPSAAQPVHLLMASLMLGLQFGMFLDTRRSAVAPVAPDATPGRVALEQAT
jgi:heme a synthase